MITGMSTLVRVKKVLNPFDKKKKRKRKSDKVKSRSFHFFRQCNVALAAESCYYRMRLLILSVTALNLVQSMSYKSCIHKVLSD